MDHEIKKIVKQSLNLFDYEKYIPLSKSGKTTAYFAFWDLSASLIWVLWPSQHLYSQVELCSWYLLFHDRSLQKLCGQAGIRPCNP